MSTTFCYRMCLLFSRLCCFVVCTPCFVCRMFMSPKRITSGALTYRFRLPVRVLGYELQGISTSKTGLSTSPDPCDWILEATNDPDGDECWQLIDVQQNHNPESWAAASSDDQRKRFQIRTGKPHVIHCMLSYSNSHLYGYYIHRLRGS